MANPWTKNNPLLSTFLSGANAWAGAIRGTMAAQARRRQRTAVRRGAEQATGLWASALTGTPRRRKKRRS